MRAYTLVYATSLSSDGTQLSSNKILYSSWIDKKHKPSMAVICTLCFHWQTETSTNYKLISVIPNELEQVISTVTEKVPNYVAAL